MFSLAQSFLLCSSALQKRTWTLKCEDITAGGDFSYLISMKPGQLTRPSDDTEASDTASTLRAILGSR